MLVSDFVALRRIAFAIAAVISVAACSSTDSPASSATSNVAASTSTVETTGAAAPAPDTTSPPTTAAAATISSQASDYLEEAIALMQELSINRDLVDWEELRAEAFAVAGPALLPQHTYPAIRHVLGELNDRHSIFFTPDMTEDFSQGEAIFDEPQVEVRSDGLGYVSIGSYLGDIGPQADAFATMLAQRIEAADPLVCAWIVDLRTDTGGNMWPMLAGLSPLLTEGQVGSFVYPGSKVEPWIVEGRNVFWDQMSMVDRGPVDVSKSLRPTAVLVGRLTGSSGEAVAVAFRGQPQTSLYGTSTAGKTTANEPVILSDGAMIALTMSVFTDRNGTSFGIDIAIDPDVAVSAGIDPLEVAADALLSTSTCG